MEKASFLLYHVSQNRSPKRYFFYLPITLAFTTFLLIFIYIATTSKLLHFVKTTIYIESEEESSSPISYQTIPISVDNNAEDFFFDTLKLNANFSKDTQWSIANLFGSVGNYVNNKENVFHDSENFLEDYKQMNKSFKIYVYPYNKDDPFANLMLPVDYEPKGSYASELYFKKILMKTHFITNDPTQADLFFMPFSVVEMRHDPRIGVEGIKDFVKNYIINISRSYPYWNRTGGADHFYVACHSTSRSAMEKINKVQFNAIQVVCSSSYFLSGYIAHKDASLPQIWPRPGDPTNLDTSKRKQLAFFAGQINSPVRAALVKVWRNDSDIFAHFGRFKKPYGYQLTRSKFCLHVKGFEVNTAHISDALYYGCVPIIIADHHDLPFADILNWNSFSVVVAASDIPVLKRVLQRISFDEYSWLQSNVLKVRKHFKWNEPPADYDAFYITMYELWMRRSSVRVSLARL